MKKCKEKDSAAIGAILCYVTPIQLDHLIAASGRNIDHQGEVLWHHMHRKVKTSVHAACIVLNATLPPINYLQYLAEFHGTNMH